MQKRIKVIVLGTRGIPDIQGGVETHCQELYPRIAKKGYDITVITRTPYIKNRTITSYNGVKLKHIYAPRKKSFEAIVHTCLGILYAKFNKADILHIHAVGPSLLTPFAKLLRLNVVVTNHGPDYERKKWGKFAKAILRIGEKLGSLYADRIIVISEVIKRVISEKYNKKDSYLIYNGVNLPDKSDKTDYLNSLGLIPKKYIIGVGRFVEEKGFHDLINAYKNIKTDVKLVLVGDSDHETEYSRKLKISAKNNNVILTGFIKGDSLNQIFSNAGLFVMPSYHEGLPIALLEAMSYDLDILASDIPANLELNLNHINYFITGNIEDLKRKLSSKLTEHHQVDNYINIIKNKYNWESKALETINVYQSLFNMHSYSKKP